MERGRRTAVALSTVVVTAIGTGALVDEPDQVKTDGHYVVGVGGERSLWVAEISGHTPHVIGRLHLDGTPTSLLLAGHRALVVVEPRIAYPAGLRGGPARSGPVAGGNAGMAPIEPAVEKSQLEVIG